MDAMDGHPEATWLALCGRYSSDPKLAREQCEPAARINMERELNELPG